MKCCNGFNNNFVVENKIAVLLSKQCVRGVTAFTFKRFVIFINEKPLLGRFFRISGLLPFVKCS